MHPNQEMQHRMTPGADPMSDHSEIHCSSVQQLAFQNALLLLHATDQAPELFDDLVRLPHLNKGVLRSFPAPSRIRTSSLALCG
mmetsp:Transcript_72840/g.131214  ORF Transcript_72840/g.131214 Transcript_72840/m.131214 type:complete len:84 (+) Transcript_72840:148-399(+)